MTGDGPDVVFEYIGVPGTIEEAIRYVRKGGRVVVIGACGEQDKFTPIRALTREVDVHFSSGAHPREFDTTMALMAAGRISTEPMITHTVGIDALPRAFCRTGASQRSVQSDARVLNRKPDPRARIPMAPSAACCGRHQARIAI